MSHDQEIYEMPVEPEQGPSVADTRDKESFEDPEEDLEEDEQRQERFTLNRRQIQMIAIGSSIGAGVLYDSGIYLRNAGPGSLFLGFVLGGSVMYSVMITIGEMISTSLQLEIPYESRSTSRARSDLFFAK